MLAKRFVRLFGTLVVLGSSIFGYSNIEAIEPVEMSQLKASSYELIKEDVEKPVQEVAEVKEEVVPVVEKENTVVKEKVVQQEVVGNSIKISNSLNSTLMKDNSGDYFYLNHNENGVYDGRGVPFIDYRTNFQTRKTIIYAHSSLSGNGPFQVLQNYHNNPGFYQNNKYIDIHYQDRDYRYEIFSVYVSLADNDMSEGLEYFREMDYSDSEWANTIQKYKNNSEYETGVSVNQNDKILILQTCSMDPNYYEKYYRYNLVIMAKLIS